MIYPPENKHHRKHDTFSRHARRRREDEQRAIAVVERWRADRPSINAALSRYEAHLIVDVEKAEMLLDRRGIELTPYCLPVGYSRAILWYQYCYVFFDNVADAIAYKLTHADDLDFVEGGAA